MSVENVGPKGYFPYHVDPDGQVRSLELVEMVSGIATDREDSVSSTCSGSNHRCRRRSFR